MTTVLPAAHPLRVLFYLDSPYRLAGAQRQLLLFIRHAGPDLLPHAVAPADGPCVQAFREAGVPVTVIPAPERLLEFGKGLLRIGLLRKALIWRQDVVPHSRQVARLADRLDADVIHFNTPRGILAAGAAARMANRPSVMHLRGSYPFDGVYRYVSQAIADRIILNAEALRSEISPLFRKRCVAVSDGVEGPKRWSRMEARVDLGRRLGLSLDESTLLVLSLSSPVPFKGLHVLVDAAVELRRRAPGRKTVFLLAGSSDDERYKTHLAARIAAAGLLDVHLLGYDPDPEQLVVAADVLALPTIDRVPFRYPDGERIEVRSNEGLPQAILEALAAGVPVVASRVAGTPEEVIDGSTGLLVPQNDPVALADRLDHLLRSSELREHMGRSARADASRRFDADVQARRVLTELRAVIRPS